ncbi:MULTISPECIES: hypothetical protein [Pseudomonas]|uniref:hypothetical protein n=1 Tax=Pseudomonas TaxID=286 RepID=UPI0015A32482|nr:MULTISPECIES: hypothetical protein [Pseudomonas]NWC92866.1 hypothetical protein [Pseudomonas sp. IPO3779]NWD21315.1 hypothetical protein [Pseudomonas sp. IPO3778]NWD24560.1 hypothetical protein [Pseudomonas yamanorum]
MKKLLLALFFFNASVCSAATAVLNPMDFDGSDAQKKQVLDFVTATVKKDYCEKIDMCQESTLRMMEKQNLDAFKQATKATDRKIMDAVIRDYCGKIDMCNYGTIWMMYKQNFEASNKKLAW